MGAQGTADGLTNGLDAFNLIVDRGLKMLEQALGSAF